MLCLLVPEAIASRFRVGTFRLHPQTGHRQPSEALRYDAETPIEVATLVQQQLKADDRVAVLRICYLANIRLYIKFAH